MIQSGMASFATRRLLKRLAQLTIGLVVFAQVALAAQACMLQRADPARAFGDAMASGECGGVAMDRAMCLADCLKTDQASPSVKFHFDAILPPASPVAEWIALRKLDRPAIHVTAAYRPSGPPLQIFFCTFQT